MVLAMRLQHASIVFPVLLSACAASGEGASHLAETSWRFTSIDGATPANSDAELTFEDDRIGANVGCNGMGGPWRTENGRLIAGPLIQTEMFCAGEVWGQEKAVSALLAATPRYELEGDTLILRSRGHVAELERTAEQPDQPSAGA